MSKNKSQWYPARIEYAPPASEPWLKNHIDTVTVPAGQIIDWLWTHTDHGRFVSGYILTDANETNT